MDLMPREAINARRALTRMPPLIKGYVRLGAMVGDGCVVDHDFGTTDIFIVLPVERIAGKYITYYSTDSAAG
jgi:putative hemolysin